jgi:biopolymer transport protein ExbD
MPATTLTNLLAREHRRRARVEIIPLIDVIFFLLATFVLFTLSVNRILSLDVDLPFVPPPPGETSEALDLRVSDHGTLYWDGEVMTVLDLPARLADLKQNDPSRKIMISSDPRALLGDATAVLDAVRGAKFEQVTFNTRPPSYAH